MPEQNRKPGTQKGRTQAARHLASKGRARQSLPARLFAPRGHEASAQGEVGSSPRRACADSALEHHAESMRHGDRSCRGLG